MSTNSLLLYSHFKNSFKNFFAYKYQLLFIQLSQPSYLPPIIHKEHATGKIWQQ